VRVRVGALLAAGLLLVAAASCSAGDDEVVDFGARPGEDAPRVPADDGVDVFAVPAPDAVPPTDARLVSGGWPEAAAFIAREARAGNPTLVNIFASWCGPCRAEMPMLLAAREANPEITFLGIDHLDRREDGEAFVEELGVDFATIHDLAGDVAFAVGGRGMPTTVVFDREGQLAGRVVGELTETSLAQLLDEVR
jgi:cytochrome c biogenesis protein CcmG, thiol:disulfide interchange protein DsbE